MQISIVDLATVAPGRSEADALADALETARNADALGFHRSWFAEHHGTSAVASHHPELLIAAAASQTTGIRVGSGAVLMNHYSAFKVAELFKQLEAISPVASISDHPFAAHPLVPSPLCQRSCRH